MNGSKLRTNAWKALTAGIWWMAFWKLKIRLSLQKRALPKSANFHLVKPCNFRCKFCFATFTDVDVKLGLPIEEAERIIVHLAKAGVDKLTFVGGEPTLHPELHRLVRLAKSLKMTTCIVTNGYKLTDPYLDAFEGALDWVGLSIDSLNDETNVHSGRAFNGKRPMTRADYLEKIRLLRERGIRLKINTVVHALNFDENMAEFINESKPERWKIFQMLPVEGQNDRHANVFTVSTQQFSNFIARHRAEVSPEVSIVPEDNDAMRGSYAMIDPLGRFYDDTQGGHTYSQPILQVGIQKAFNQVQFSSLKFQKRGGEYLWK
jgi:radical S-adenosyl methionine domain-containing protein 2